MKFDKINQTNGMKMKRLISIFIAILIPFSAFAEVLFYDTDNTGTPVAMWDTEGNKAWEAEYYPFGEEFRVDESTRQNDKRLIGKEKDKETGLTYFGARYLDDKSGRFLTPDPVRPVDPFTSRTNYVLLENPQRLNRYAYGLNNPYRYVDPDGNCPIAVIALAAAGAWAMDAVMPQSTDVLNSKGFLDHADNATMVAGIGGSIKAVTTLPKVIKALNSNLPHAIARGVERGIFSDAKVAAEELKKLSSIISKNKSFPSGTIQDTAHADRVLVPIGDNGRAVYQITKNGKANLKTTLIDKAKKND